MTSTSSLPDETVEKVALRECPFCGSSEVQLQTTPWHGEEGGSIWTECMNCGASPFPPAHSEKDAAAAWNTRASYEGAMGERIAELEAQVSKLRGAIGWIEPPFVDGETTEDELRKRIHFCVIDAERATSKGE